MESASLLPRSTASLERSVLSRRSLAISRRLRFSNRQVWRRATVASHELRRLLSGKVPKLWIRIVKVVCVMSAASSWDSPYLKGMEYTRRSYLFSSRCHALGLPSRQLRISCWSELATPLRLFTNTRIQQHSCTSPLLETNGAHQPYPVSFAYNTRISKHMAMNQR